MCGIYGMVSLSGRELRYPELAPNMASLLAHRGPDSGAVLTRPHALVGARRLRIVDLHPRADQPFSDPGGCVWLTCNGEIYNAANLRKRFAAYPFRSHSDVEVMIPMYLERGVEAIPELAGMFAMAIMDQRSGTLCLARDPAGEKPLFYLEAGEEVWFASEIQALLQHPAVARRLSQHALEEFVTMGYVREPRTMFTEIRSVEPGTCLLFRPEGRESHRLRRPAVSCRISDPVLACKELTRALERAAERQIVSHSPIGIFTSGGLDSSLLAALAARALPAGSVHTFTAQVAAESYDESGFGKYLATQLGTVHRTVPAGLSELSEALEAITHGVAEPISDPAVLPTWLLAREAKQTVNVVISGEGADELFGGYPTYLGHKLAPAFTRLPGLVKSSLRHAASHLPASQHKVPLSWLLSLFLTHTGRPWLERHQAWFGTGLDTTALLGTSAPSSPPSPLSAEPAAPPLLEAEQVLSAAMYYDYHTYLRNQLLVKLDRSTMLFGLEARAPYLDPAVTECAFALDPRLKIRGLETKWILKQVARRFLPDRIRRRRKRGLSLPIGNWINHELCSEVDRLLDPARLRRQGRFSDVYVSQLLAAHRSRKANHGRALWTLIVLQRWLEHWVPEAA